MKLQFDKCLAGDRVLVCYLYTHVLIQNLEDLGFCLIASLQIILPHIWYDKKFPINFILTQKCDHSLVIS